MTPVEEMNRALDGSPYLINNDEPGCRRAEFLADELSRIASRHQNVEARFSEVTESIRKKLDEITGTRLVYESNALELAGLPLDETRNAIAAAPRDVEKLAEYMTGQAIRADRHLTEVLGLYRATQFAKRLAAEYRQAVPVRETDIRELHAATVPGEAFAGQYRDVEVQISGSGHVPPSVLDVAPSMRELVDWLNQTEAPPPLSAAVAHSWLTIIHPFRDGNGRVARLLANVVLLRSGWPALVIRKSDRIQYLDALGASDEAGDLLPLFDLFIKSIKRGLKDLERPTLTEELFEADLRKNKELPYKIWSSQLDEFLETLRIEARQSGFDVMRLAVPDSSTFRQLSHADISGNTWLAKVRHPDGRDYLLWLGYMSHEMLDNGDAQDPAPSIFVSARDREGITMHPYLSPQQFGSPIEIDEISLVPDVLAPRALYRIRGLTVLDDSISGIVKRLVGQISAAA